jgi:hypothetical protein
VSVRPEPERALAARHPQTDLPWQAEPVRAREPQGQELVWRALPARDRRTDHPRLARGPGPESLVLEQPVLLVLELEERQVPLVRQMGRRSVLLGPELPAREREQRVQRMGRPEPERALQEHPVLPVLVSQEQRVLVPRTGLQEPVREPAWREESGRVPQKDRPEQVQASPERQVLVPRTGQRGQEPALASQVQASPERQVLVPRKDRQEPGQVRERAWREESVLDSALRGPVLAR